MSRDLPAIGCGAFRVARRGERSAVFLASVLCVFCPGGAADAAVSDWQLQPTLRASETYSNNVRLEKVQPQHDWVSELAGGFSVNRSVERSSTAFAYQLQGLHFVRTSAMDEVFQQLHGMTHIQRSETGPYLDGLANISQQTIDANLPSVSDNIFATGNRTNQTDFTLAPGVRSKIGSTALSDLNVSHSQTEYGKGRIDSFNDAVDLKLSDLYPKRLDWQLTARKERVRYSNDAATEFRNTVLNLQFGATQHLQLVLTGGYDDVRSDTPGSLNRDGSRWSAGIDWAPSPRSRLLLTAGERYFGNTYQMELSHLYHEDRWAMSYAEEVVTSANDAATQNPVSADVGGVASYTTGIYLSKLFTGSYLHRGHRGDVNVEFYQDRREYDRSLGVEDLRSALVKGFVRVWPKTSLNVSASWLNRDPVNATTTDKTRDLSIWLAHDLEKGGTLSLRFMNLHRADSGSIIGYDSSALSVLYERQFGLTSLFAQDSTAGTQ